VKLNKDTWHGRNWEYWLKTSVAKRAYKYREDPWGRTRSPANLCIYFWVAVARTPWLKAVRNEKVQLAVMSIFIYAIAFVLGNVGFSEFLGMSPLFMFLINPLLALIAVGIVIACVTFGSFLIEKYRHRKYIHRKSEPNIVREYAKAKKSKVCPIIEFEDDRT